MNFYNVIRKAATLATQTGRVQLEDVLQGGIYPEGKTESAKENPKKQFPWLLVAIAAGIAGIIFFWK